MSSAVTRVLVTGWSTTELHTVIPSIETENEAQLRLEVQEGTHSEACACTCTVQSFLVENMARPCNM